MASNTRTTPSHVQFMVGRDPALSASATNQDHIFERIDALGEVQIEITNHSRTENLVLELQNGATNLDGGYSTRQTRVAGTLGNTVTVPPLQTATAVVDGPNASGAQRYWRFRASNQLRAWGTVTVTHTRGELVRRNLFPG
jgi:hypothetical protein